VGTAGFATAKTEKEGKKKVGLPGQKRGRKEEKACRLEDRETSRSGRKATYPRGFWASTIFSKIYRNKKQKERDMPLRTGEEGRGKKGKKLFMGTKGAGKRGIFVLSKTESYANVAQGTRPLGHG